MRDSRQIAADWAARGFSCELWTDRKGFAGAPGRQAMTHVDKLWLRVVCSAPTSVALATIGFLFCASHSVSQAADQVVAKPTPSTADWPRWRGPNADGVADGRNLPIRCPSSVMWASSTSSQSARLIRTEGLAPR